MEVFLPLQLLRFWQMDQLVLLGVNVFQVSVM